MQLLRHIRACTRAFKHLTPGAWAQELDAADAAALKKRKLVVLKTWKTYHITRGSKFARERRKLAHDLTFEMLQK